jgi:hypothetical protein
MLQITDSIWVDEAKSIQVFDGTQGAYGVAILMRNNFPIGTDEPIYYLDTGLERVLVRCDNTEEVAELLGLDPDELINCIPENHRYQPKASKPTEE